jgi:hypothetical protein
MPEPFFIIPGFVNQPAGYFIYLFLCVLCALAFYLCALRFFRNYKAAPAVSALLLVLLVVFISHLSIQFALALLAALASFFAYTFCDAKGLKHNQDKHFLLLSVCLYVISALLSNVFMLLPVFMAVYEIVRGKNFSSQKALARIIPFIFCSGIIISLYLLKP